MNVQSLLWEITIKISTFGAMDIKENIRDC